ncbi:MAG: AI-2E family transporter [Patescibacteria group bacterium]
MDFSKVKNLIFLSLLVLATSGFLYILKPFFYPIFWAAVMASVVYPIYRSMAKKTKSPNLSSVLTVVIVVFIIIIPVVILGSLIVKESLEIYDSINNNKGAISESIKNLIGWIKNNQITQRFNIDEQVLAERLTDITKTITSYIFTGVKNLTQNSLTFLVMFVITIYTLFFFLRDGEKMLKKIMHICPLGDKHEIILYKKFTSTSRATLKGTLIIGAIQGALGALLFTIVGVQGALIWGIVMMLFSVIPGFGSYVVWLPAAIVMFLIGNVWQGIVIVAVGTLIISTIDNFIRPILVGKDTQMHPLLILFSTLGGLIFFGISGFVIGPIITALLLSLWEMYEEYYHSELDHNGNG